MIIKVHSDLRDAVLAKKASPSELTVDVPEWLISMMEDGNFLVMQPEEYYSIPHDVRGHLEVVHR